MGMFGYGGGGGSTSAAQETAQNAALGNATAENPAVAGNDPTRDVTIKSATAEDVTGTSSVQGGVVTATEQPSGAQSQLAGDGTLTGWTYQIDPEMFEGLGANTDLGLTNPVADRASSIGPWVLGRAYSFPMIVVNQNNNGFFLSIDTPTAYVATADDEPGEGVNQAAHWLQIGKLTTAVEVAKLGGIEASADVTDATNVAAAGAVMTSALVVKQSIATLTDAADVTPDFATSNNFELALLTATGASRNLKNPLSPTIGQSGIIYLVQDGTGSLAIVFDTYYKFASGVKPELSTAASAVDRLVYFVRSATFIDCQLVAGIA